MGAHANHNREVVGILSTRADFESAIDALLAAGVERSDLSVLSSHESLAVADGPATPWKDALTALVGDIKYEGPLVASGAILLAGGATAAIIASLIGAAVGGMALKEIVDEVAASPHTDDFTRSLEAGCIILWCRVSDDRQQEAVASILKQFNASSLHVRGLQD